MKLRIFALVLSTVSLIFAAATAIGPSQHEKSVITWKPKTSTDSGNLLLSRAWPQHFLLEVPCSQANFSDQALLDIGSFSLLNDRDRAVLSMNGNPILQVTTIEDSNSTCDTQIEFSANENSIVLSKGTMTDASLISDSDFQSMKIDYLSWNNVTADNVELILKTRTIATSYSQNQKIFVSLSIFFLIVSLYVLYVSRSRNTKPLRKTQRIKSCLPSDCIVGVILLSSAVFTPAHYDDGPIYSIVRGYNVLGNFTSIYEPINTSTPLGYWSWWLMRPLFSNGIPIVWIKIAVAAILFLSWVIIRRQILPIINPLPSMATIVAGVGFAVYASTWAMNLRAESIIVLLLVLEIACVLKYLKFRNIIHLGLAFLFSGLAIAHHQLGLASVGPLLIVLPQIWRDLNDKFRRLSVLSISILAASLTIQLVFLDSDVSTFRESTSDFRRMTGHEFSLGKVTDRLRWFLDYGSNSARLFITISLISFLLYAVFLIGQEQNKHARQLVLIVSSPAIGLLFSASQWPWHLAILTIAFTVFVFLVSAQLSFSRSSGKDLVAQNKWLTTLVTANLLFVGISLASSTAWAPFDLITRNWLRFSQSFGATSENSLIWLLILVLAASVLYNLGRWTSNSFFGMTSMSMLLLLPLTMNFFWIAKDSVETKEWTYAGQSISGLRGNNQCGILDEMTILGDSHALNISDRYVTDIGELAFPVGFDVTGSFSETPIPTQSSWGTWLPFENISQSGFVGKLYSPWYSTPEGIKKISFWYQRGIPNSAVLKLETNNKRGIRKSFEIPNESFTGWQLFSLSIASDVTDVRFEMYDPHREDGGWIAVTAPVVEQERFNVESSNQRTILSPLEPIALLSNNSYVNHGNLADYKISNLYSVSHARIFRTRAALEFGEVMPRYLLNDETVITFLTAANSVGTAELSITSYDQQNKQIETIDLPISLNKTFSLLSVPLHNNAFSISIMINKDQGTVFTSEPLVASQTLVIDDPNVYHQTSILGTAAPCVDAPYTRTGVVPSVQYSVGLFNGVMAPIEAGRFKSKSQLGCLTETKICLLSYRYTSAPIWISKIIE
jgi:hypothetical protein